MLGALVVLLIIFWVAGYGPFGFLADPLFTFNTVRITLWDILIFLIFIWIIGSLPSPLSQIGMVIVILWLLSTFGLFSFLALPIALPNIIVIAVIVGLVIYLLGGI